MDQEDRIRERAHCIWEEEGRPVGRHEQHWQRACHEIDAETRHVGPNSGNPASPNTASQSGTTSGLVGAADTDERPLATGAEDLTVAGRLSDPNENQPTTGRSKLVGA
jgi:hypothetical protein